MPAVIDNPALAMYVAAAVALVVMIGFFWYLWSLDRTIAAIRRQLSDGESVGPQPAPPLRPRRRLEQEQSDGSLRP